MPNIRKDKMDALIQTGRSMSNICFNLAQDQTLPARTREVMNLARIDWDKAVSKIRKSEREPQ